MEAVEAAGAGRIEPRRDPGDSVLLTDLYQLTMLKAYWEHGMNEIAVFDLFVRRLPPQRNFLVAAGLAPALDYLEGLRFEPDELEWLEGQPGFPAEFVHWLADLRFRGDVEAMPEGTVFFPEEPVLRVTAPLPQAQLVETRLISLINFSSLIASKAVRFASAAPGMVLVDFGLRRSHGSEAGLLAARSAYLAGFDGTATVAAGQRWGIPTYGTMAHSYVQAHDSEAEAFLRFARAHPDSSERKASRSPGCASTPATSPRTRTGCAGSWTRVAAPRSASSRAVPSMSTTSSASPAPRSTASG